MRYLQEVVIPERVYQGVQDPPFMRAPLIGSLYRYHIIEVNGVKYAADDTLLQQCVDGEEKLEGTIPLYEDEVRMEDCDEEAES